MKVGWSAILSALLLAATLACVAGQGCAKSKDATPHSSAQHGQNHKVANDTLSEANNPDRYRTLTEEDFRIVAEQLNVEVAAIKAVVSIEAGSKMEGFWAPGIPVVNFDRTMYNKFRAKGGKGATGEKVPAGLKGYALQEWTQLINARKVSADGANMGTFWGMFQIGGFNYKLCGCQTVNEMVKRMSYSELEQLELFAAFITNAGMLKDLQACNWAGFARKYNGPNYAKRGYHTRMAAAYKKFKSAAPTSHKAASNDAVKGKALGTAE